MRLRLFLAGALAAVVANGNDYTHMFENEEQNQGATINYERIVFTEPTTPSSANTLLLDTFQNGELEGWQKLKAPKFSGKWGHRTRRFDWIVGDKAIRMDSDSAYHGLARPLARTVDFQETPNVFATFEVQQENVVNCGGAYFKLYHTDKTADKDVASFNDQTPYSIMFGPDKCGYMTNKVHLIAKYPVPGDTDGEYHEAHLDASPRVPEGSQAHQYGFGFFEDGRVTVWVDGKESKSGTLRSLFKKDSWANAEDMDDPEDFKPADWIDDPMIPDPEATKPDDWDEEAPEFIVDEDAVMPDGWKEDTPLYIENPDAEKPEDWDDEEDGEWHPPKMRNPECYIGCGKWTPPMKSNPDYKGKWEAPLIENPDYKGPWAPRKIPNPAHWSVDDPHSVLQPFNAIGFEVWTVDAGSMIDNIFITTSEEDFHRFIKETYEAKTGIEARNIDLRKEVDKLQPDVDEEDVDKLSGSGSRLRTILLFGGSLLIPIGLTVYGMRRTRKVPVSDAEAKKDDDKPADKAESLTKENKAASDSEEDTSAPTSATEKVPVQRRVTRKTSAQQQKAE